MDNDDLLGAIIVHKIMSDMPKTPSTEQEDKMAGEMIKLSFYIAGFFLVLFMLMCPIFFILAVFGFLQ
jgi:hypothetical protein